MMMSGDAWYNVTFIAVRFKLLIRSFQGILTLTFANFLCSSRRFTLWSSFLARKYILPLLKYHPFRPLYNAFSSTNSFISLRPNCQGLITFPTGPGTTTFLRFHSPLRPLILQASPLRTLKPFHSHYTALHPGTYRPLHIITSCPLSTFGGKIGRFFFIREKGVNCNPIIA